MSEDANGRISVSRADLRAELGSLELRLVDRLSEALRSKADADTVRELREKVHALAGTVTAIAHIPGEVVKLSEQVGSLQQTRAAQQGLSTYQRFIFGTVAVGLIGSIATLLWLAMGSH